MKVRSGFAIAFRAQLAIVRHLERRSRADALAEGFPEFGFR